MIDNKDLRVPELEKGVYEHYSNKRYEVLGVALHSESLEPLVVYRPLYETTAELWVRPYEMFIGEVAINGHMQKRFKKVSDTES